MFSRDSVIRRVNAEPAILFGAGRALLLQLAHPSVAQGVDDHSDFQHNPFKRLQGTLEATYAVVFGDEALAAGVGRRIRWIHDHVTGPSYQANDPANLLWVHATLFDTALSCYERLVAPLSARDRETYYEEMTQVAAVFGCPRDAQPADLTAFERYFDEQVATLEVTDVGRALARDIVRPTLPLQLHWPLAPALGLHRRAAIGLTPAPLREKFEFAWTAADQRRLDRVMRAARATFLVTPRVARVAPGHLNGRYLLWRARRHVAAFDARVDASAPARNP
ncbi:MAG TPA: oxygenase MpaB family protein [Acidimicrobiales bacterium]|nr:oxygenase MpaB family protein [Acidimicrobiales bacterium]